MNKLAAFGGTAAVRRIAWRDWPLIEDEDRKAVLDTLDGGRLVFQRGRDETRSPPLRSNGRGVRLRHCVAVSTAPPRCPWRWPGSGSGRATR